jgi:septal ring factor EnvC (AmiA/AmiB activator)
MLRQLYGLASRLFSLNRDIQQNRTDISNVQQEVREVRQEVRELRQEFGQIQREFHELTLAVQRFMFELHAIREHEAHEREKMALRLENELLRSERHLPPAKPDRGSESG